MSTMHAAQRRIGEDPAHLYGEPITLIGSGGVWEDTDFSHVPPCKDGEHENFTITKTFLTGPIQKCSKCGAIDFGVELECEELSS